MRKTSWFFWFLDAGLFLFNARLIFLNGVDPVTILMMLFLGYFWANNEKERRIAYVHSRRR